MVHLASLLIGCWINRPVDDCVQACPQSARKRVCGYFGRMDDIAAEPLKQYSHLSLEALIEQSCA